MGPSYQRKLRTALASLSYIYSINVCITNFYVWIEQHQFGMVELCIVVSYIHVMMYTFHMLYAHLKESKHASLQNICIWQTGLCDICDRLLYTCMY